MKLQSVLFIALASSTQAFALPPVKGKPIPMIQISVDNPYASPRVRDRVFRRSLDYWREYGIKFNKRKLLIRKDPFFDIRDEGSLDSFKLEFWSWSLTLLRYLTPNISVHVMAPPWRLNGVNYMGGVAFMDKLRQGAFSYSNCMELSDAGVPRFRHCVVAVAHELGHSVLGCQHEEGPSLMHYNALFEQTLIEGTGRLLPLGPLCLEKVRNRK